MITPEYARVMAAYNAEMNRRLYDAAGRLTDAEARQDRGAFWGSIHGTLAHLLWADRMWMHRFAGWDRPAAALADSARDERPFPELRAEREGIDARMEAWAGALDPAWLQGDLTWFSGALGREMSRPKTLVLAHMFNHQTHHRGQAHAMLTAAGQQTGSTDLIVLVQ